MFELYPYFTNDGTVGLFSPSNDDIYHSTHGALSESWEKFIIPSRLEEYLASHNDVKILDICYGIGYNTKTALQVFINNFLENEKNKTKSENNLKKDNSTSHSIASIDTDNISIKESEKFEENYSTNNYSHGNLCPEVNGCNASVDTDNILTSANLHEVSSENNLCRKILIDAVDTDKVLTKLSPFITRGIKNNNLFKKYVVQKYLKSDGAKNKLIQIQKMTKPQMKPLQKKYKLDQEVSMIILKKMLDKNPEFLNDPILLTILNSKKYEPFLSQNMLHFVKFYSNQGCDYNKILNKTPFLHNIYYQYVSTSYKNMKNLLSLANFDLNFFNEDARKFIKTTNNNYNFIFLDAFTPAKCPALWSLEFFRELYCRLDKDGLLLTYSSSAAIRNALLLNGFSVGKIYDESSGKFIGTVASKNYKLIQYGLDERDLALIKSRAGICFRDEDLNLDNKTIIDNREKEVEQSDLLSSSKALKGDNSAEPV